MILLSSMHPPGILSNHCTSCPIQRCIEFGNRGRDIVGVEKELDGCPDYDRLLNVENDDAGSKAIRESN